MNALEASMINEKGEKGDGVGTSPVKSDEDHQSKRQRVDTRDVACHINQYTGYSIQHMPTAQNAVPIINGKDATPEYIFQEFVSKRRPCIIDALPSTMSRGKLTMNLTKLVEVAGDEIIQVERRFSDRESFGQNRSRDRQVDMKLATFCHKLKEKDGEMFYLSTQESNEAFSPPCKQLLEKHIIDRTLCWAGNLHHHSCNIWLGRSAKGSSSGLHHDHHDNFYVLIHGIKIFRLFSPDTALQMKTYGKIEKVHANGVISYVGSETRADGAFLRSGLCIDYAEGDDEDAEVSEEEIVIGKGFDYESDTTFDDDVLHGRISGRDDFEDMQGSGEMSKAASVEMKRPNNFSRIDFSDRPLAEIARDYPPAASLREVHVSLQPDQTLYLPAGWFHEVSSASSDCDYHMAFNYWYHPPDSLKDFQHPYTDDCWILESE